MFTVHLEAAGFMRGKGHVGSPQRSILNSLKSSPPRSVSSCSARGRRKSSLTLVKIKTPMPNGPGNTIVDKKSRQRSNTMLVAKRFDFEESKP